MWSDGLTLDLGFLLIFTDLIVSIKLLEIKKWYGRYYVVKFEKNGKSIMVF